MLFAHDATVVSQIHVDVCYIDRARTENHPRTRDHATAQTTRLGRAEATSGDTAESINKRHRESTQRKQGAVHKRQGILRYKKTEQNPTTTSSTKP
jgi:hypothetical protein